MVRSGNGAAAAAPEIEQVAAGGVTLRCLRRGQGPLVLCLHGFPDTAWSFAGLLAELADAGYCAVAPFMRGYAPSTVAVDGDYSLTALAGDVCALADHYGDAHYGDAGAWVVGHDWGAAAAYAVAALHPQRIAGIVAAAVPPLRRFLFHPTLRQIRASHYMFKFQLPGWAERRIPADDHAWLIRLAQSWSPGWEMPTAYAEQVKAALGSPARLHGALGYYRAIPRLLLDGETRRRLLRPAPVPARVIFGGGDRCILPEMFSDLAPYFTAAWDSMPIADAGHFMHLEAPAAFSAAVLGFIDSYPGRS